MEQKKPTNAQLQRRIQRAVVHLDRTKNTQEIYFSDKGLRLVSDTDYCVIETGFHRHVFSNITSSGISRPWLYTKRIVEIANEHLEDCKTEDGYSFAKLLESLKAKEDKTEYNICVYYEWWCQIIFDGLYSISEDDVSQWFVYFKYLNVFATNYILLSEKTEDMTNKQFVERFKNLLDEFTAEVEERVLFKALSDEEKAKQEIEAIQANELEQQTQNA